MLPEYEYYEFEKIGKRLVIENLAKNIERRSKRIYDDGLKMSEKFQEFVNIQQLARNAQNILINLED
ncbi:hypothetical protein HXA34_20450 [Salipaludibacillus agaradhaerens]|uniref:hypothetical protein n=1 Tax=Salipaludibacillus agaradhaerens TaxID=76935 RepID=UPI00215116DE|nr:hypothetical protein [Salipaludibacillus agaradhaerens]MCR6108669.1 hypothetical protein [Salipaludibacillus agaradhaerens]MCR6120693.1 hypothetical protein [Salipaludibacillus agaradhaerens]